MGSTTEITVDGFVFTLIAGEGRMDGVVLNPNIVTPETLASSEFLQALGKAIRLYPQWEAVSFLDYHSMYGDKIVGFFYEEYDMLIEKADIALSQTYFQVDREWAERVRDLAMKRKLKAEKQPKPYVMESGYVYLLQSDRGYYKIGRTKNPKDRRKTFNVKLPFEVEFICLIKTDDMRRMEADLHKKYAEKRSNGEWFALTQEDVLYIKSLAEAE